MDRLLKKISAVSLVMVICFGTIFSVQTFASESNPLGSVANYIQYLEHLDLDDEGVDGFKLLSIDKQEKILEVLRNGGELDVTIRETPDADTVYKKGSKKKDSQRSVGYEADFGLFGVTFVTVKLEGRFTHSGATVKEVKSRNAYIVKNILPLSGFERTSLDAYVNNGKFYASAAFTAYVGAKIGDNTIGVKPRTFYINYNCDGSGIGEGNAW